MPCFMALTYQTIKLKRQPLRHATYRRNAYLRHCVNWSGHDLDLWDLTLKTFTTMPLSWWMFVLSFIKICSLSKQTLRHMKQVLTNW